MIGYVRVPLHWQACGYKRVVVGGWACVGYGVCLNGVELVMQFVAKGVCHVLLLKGPSMTDGVPNGGSRKVCGRNSRTEESQFGPISR